MKLLLSILLTFSAYTKEFNSMGMKLNFNYLKINEKSVIWGFDFLDKDKLFYTTKKGLIYSYDLKKKSKKLIAHDLKNIQTKAQGGLLDLLIYKNHIYVSFSKKNKKGSLTALAKAKLNEEKLNFNVIFESKSQSKNVYHYGSRLLINNDYIYMTIGDRGQRDRAQSKSFHNGKVLKLKLDGSLDKNEKSFIYTLGYRNPQGITSYNNKIYVGEFGPQGGDEINLLTKGNNYGWPKVTFGQEYGGGKIGKKKGYTMPLTYWDPSISFSGINFYTGNKIPKWKGQLFLACLGASHLRRVNINDFNDQEVLLKDLSQRFRMVRMSPDQKLYISFDSGKIGYISK